MKNLKRKILFFINTLTGGGAEKVLIDIVNNMDKEKFDITIQTLVDEGVHKKSIISDVKYKSIIKTKNKFIKKVLQYFLNFIFSPGLTYNFFIKSDYDYEVAFLEGIPTKILSYSTNKKAKKYAWIHTDLYNNFSGHQKIFKDFDKYIECYKRYDKIFCVSTGVKEGFLKRFGAFENVDIVYNPYDDKKIRKLSSEAQNEIPEDDIFKIITVGRLVEQKGYERLLKVHNKLISDGFKHHLYILGEGEKREVLEKYINDNNLKDSVTLLGFKTNPYKYVKACDLFVCSSFAEGFSTAVAESVILGVPVVSTDVSGAKEILGESQFGLVVGNDMDSLYDGIRHAFESNDYYKEKAVERSKYFELNKLIRNIEQIFNGGN